ncbi:MAG: hypothetical protein RBS56_04200 [Candidatus Gracilibacteria bacterium]|nr:hypothetical protein [Candidatus Gracilibacteria bacterium]
MKKIIAGSVLVLTLIVASGCGAIVVTTGTDENTNTETNNEETNTEPSSVAYADLNMDLMSINDTKEYKLVRFSDLDGTCLEAGFPTNLVYKTTNMIMTEDEKYVDQWTSLDFTGKLSFSNVPLTAGPASCKIATVKGVNTAQISCSVKEGEENKEICTGSVKLTVEK